MDELGVMMGELDAWHITNTELIKLGFLEGWDDSKLKKFHAAIMLWGERLAILRRSQSVETVESALQHALIEEGNDG